MSLWRSEPLPPGIPIPKQATSERNGTSMNHHHCPWVAWATEDQVEKEWQPRSPSTKRQLLQYVAIPLNFQIETSTLNQIRWMTWPYPCRARIDMSSSLHAQLRRSEVSPDCAMKCLTDDAGESRADQLVWRHGLRSSRNCSWEFCRSNTDRIVQVKS